jgi:hypothetical protein
MFCFFNMSEMLHSSSFDKNEFRAKTNFHNYCFNKFNNDRFVFYIIHSHERRLYLQGSIDTILRLLI